MTCFIIFLLSGGRLNTCGRVMKAPPSIGHDLIMGNASIVVCPYITGDPKIDFIGKAVNAVNGAPRYLNGSLSNLVGSAFNCMTFFQYSWKIVCNSM